MGSGITIWIRPNHGESSEAQAFLKHHRYEADRARLLPNEAPTRDELELLATSMGGDFWPLVDLRNPRYRQIVPGQAADVTQLDLLALLEANPDLLKAPILLTPKGAVAGFREQRWRNFLDIGKGR